MIKKKQIPCPYAGTKYADVPGYTCGFGCPVCKGISWAHVAIQVTLRPITLIAWADKYGIRLHGSGANKLWTAAVGDTSVTGYASMLEAIAALKMKYEHITALSKRKVKEFYDSTNTGKRTEKGGG